MDDFTVSLAGVPIGIHPLRLEVKAYFTDYLSDAQPHFTVGVSEEDLEYERIQSRKRYRDPNGQPPSCTDRYIESLALLRKITYPMLDYQTILFHGSTLAVNGKAYLFTAPSGTGKTTHTRLWLKLLPQAYVLNGDKPFLKVQPDGTVLACGVPWRGKERLGCNEILPLEAICVLERSPENHIDRISPKEALKMLLQRAHIPEGPDAMIKVLHIVNSIRTGVRLFRLGCNMEPEAAQVSIHAMVPDCSMAEAMTHNGK